MDLILASAGSYPRIGDVPEQQILRRAIALREKGEKTDKDLAEAENQVTRAAIKEQTEAGLDLITDGQIRWYDPISHIAGKLTGVKINGLLRFFDTNFYFRQPVVDGELKWKEPIVTNEFLFAESIATKPVKPLLTGPYTLAKLSIVQHNKYKDVNQLVSDYAQALAEEVKRLSEAGAEIIQIDEPFLLKKPQKFGIFSQAIQTISRAKGKASLALYTYFGDTAPLYGRLQELPVDLLGIDFTYNWNLVDRIAAEGSTKSLGLGLIDGRNTKLEDNKVVLRMLEKILPKIKSGPAYLNPSCGLEYLPRERAFEKLQNMAKIKNQFAKGV